MAAQPPVRRGGSISDVAEFGGHHRPTSAQQVAAHIRRMIFANELTAGERVPQDEIATALRVSRVPVREAVIALDREGWVTTEAHRGAFVNGLDAETVRDHYDLLGMVYGLAARRATERGTAVEVARLDEVHRLLLSLTDPDELWRANGAFLRQLLDMARSRRIVAMARILAVSMVPGRYFEQVPGAVQVHKKGVRAMVRAVKAGDADRAEAEYRKIVRAEVAGVLALLDERGILTR